MNTARPDVAHEIMVPDLLACLTGEPLDVLVSPLSSDAAQDRRRARRIPVADLSVAMRLTMPGTGDLALVNISESGALIETARYLRLHGMADVSVRLERQRHTLRARIVRVQLQSITPAGAVYQAALQFETRFLLPACDPEGAEGSDARIIRAADLPSSRAADERGRVEIVTYE